MQFRLTQSCRYHNRIHAADVLQSLHVLLCRGNLLANGIVDDTALLACHLSAIIHDFEHRYGAKGVTARWGLGAWDGLHPVEKCQVWGIAAGPAVVWTWEGAHRGVKGGTELTSTCWCDDRGGGGWKHKSGCGAGGTASHAAASAASRLKGERWKAIRHCATCDACHELVSASCCLAVLSAAQQWNSTPTGSDH